MPGKTATVTEISELAPRVIQLTIAFPEGGLHFTPGQYINIHLSDGIVRAYTIASAPERPEAVQLCVRLGEGQGAAALRKLETGAAVRVDGPVGRFVLPSEKRDVVFLAGDTGIAPVRSIILHMLATKDPRKITVLYEPDGKNILYSGDFDPMARDGAIRHESGAIEVLIERNRKLLSEARLMIAGFDPFLRRAQDTLRAAGMKLDGAIVESFGALP